MGGDGCGDLRHKDISLPLGAATPAEALAGPPHHPAQRGQSGQAAVALLAEACAGLLHCLVRRGQARTGHACPQAEACTEWAMVAPSGGMHRSAVPPGPERGIRMGAAPPAEVHAGPQHHLAWRGGGLIHTDDENYILFSFKVI